MKTKILILKKLFIVLCLVITPELSIGQTFKTAQLNKKGLFDTNQSLKIDRRHFMHPVDLKAYNKLIIRHKEFFSHGPEYECETISDNERTESISEGWLNAQDFESYISEMIKNSGRFDVIEDYKDLSESTKDYLYLDVSFHWMGCYVYQFEMRVVHPNNGNEKELLFIGMDANVLLGIGRRLTHPVLNAYIKWADKSKSNNIALKPVEYFLEDEILNIGNQVWMKQNLNISAFKNGDIIKQATSEKEWLMAVENEEPAWCYFQFNPINGHRFGKLYNIYAIEDARGLAPQDWRIPNIDDWHNLTNRELTDEKYIESLEKIQKEFNVEKIAFMYLNIGDTYKDKYIKLQITYDSLLMEIELLEDANEKQKLISKKRKYLKTFEENKNKQLYAAAGEANKELVSYTLAIDKVSKNHFKNYEINKIYWFDILRTPYYWPDYLEMARPRKAIGWFSANPGGMITKFQDSIHFNEIFEWDHYPRSAFWWFIDHQGKGEGYYSMSSNLNGIGLVLKYSKEDLKYNGFSVRCVR
jgi:uncharacterized protein (TIGR02145 family)